MHYLIKIIGTTLLTIHISYASVEKKLEAGFTTNSTIKEYVLEGNIYRKAQVKSSSENKKEFQSLDYRIMGLHNKSCHIALKKLSRYEKFHEYLDIVKLSGYNDKKQIVSLYLDSKLMPFPMSLVFRIPRIKKPGLYHFSFDKGFLKGLKGIIKVEKRKNRCLFTSWALWKGKKSRIPDTVFEIFSETLGELAIKKLFQVSQTR